MNIFVHESIAERMSIGIMLTSVFFIHLRSAK
jgi:hypothetical protein